MTIWSICNARDTESEVFCVLGQNANLYSHLQGRESVHGAGRQSSLHTYYLPFLICTMPVAFKSCPEISHSDCLASVPDHSDFQSSKDSENYLWSDAMVAGLPSQVFVLLAGCKLVSGHCTQSGTVYVPCNFGGNGSKFLLICTLRSPRKNWELEEQYFRSWAQLLDHKLDILQSSQASFAN
jgi:hypothetical protein